jgi:hypothetical protein
MTIVFGGGEMGAFIPSDGATHERTTSNSYNSSFSRCAMEAQGSVSYAESASFAAMDELWVHFTLTNGGGSNSTSSIQAIVLTNASDTNLFRVKWNRDANTLEMQYWDGAAYQTAGSAFSIDVGLAVHNCDLFVSGDSASGTCSLYIEGTRRAHATGVNLTTVAAITKVRSYGIGTVSGTAITQVVVSDESTIGGRLFTVPVAGAGSDTAWTGTYLNIDEVVCSDADFINSSVADQVSTFAVTAPTLTGYQVRAVIVTARAKKGGSGPTNLQLALRSGGTNYFSASKALDVGYGAFVEVWEDDPATGSAWVNAAVSSLQPGVKSIA